MTSPGLPLVATLSCVTPGEAVDAPLLALTDASTARPLPAALGDARADAIAAARALQAIPEDWVGGSQEEVRYGAYRAAELLERAEIGAREDLAARGDASLAARIIAPATAARWDLHGLLVPLGPDELEADPGGGEWTIRQALGHTISGQRAYGWGTAWWLAQGYAVGDHDLPAGAPDAFWETLPDELTTEAEGSPEDLRARLDETLDRSAERLAGMDDARLETGSRWSGFAVPVGFRLGRWSSHIREHTIQVEKTLVMIGRTASEPERLARHLLQAYGRAEGAVFGRPPEPAADAAVRIREAARAALDTITDAGAAARS
jgi:hypothetical protein